MFQNPFESIDQHKLIDGIEKMLLASCDVGDHANITAECDSLRSRIAETGETVPQIFREIKNSAD